MDGAEDAMEPIAAEDDWADDDDAYGDDVSFVIAAFNVDGQWTVRELPEAAGESLDDLVKHVRGHRVAGPAVAMVCVDDDWCAVIRPVPDGVRVLLSDATAALDFDLAADVIDELDETMPTEDEADASDEPWPVGEFDLLDDLGAPEEVLSIIFDDDELFASEQLLRVADELGFAEDLAELVGLDDDF